MRRRPLVIALALLLAGAGAYLVAIHIQPLLAPNGCQAGTGHGAVRLDPEQAAIAATIAGVAHRQLMPSRAVTVAYAAALQESKLHNLPYGDRDSVGVFQQRPSQGWGPAGKLKDPVYAATQFFRALARVHGYERLPVYQAAQAVQRSADGYAYSRFQPMAAKLTEVFTGRAPHAVWCWTGSPQGRPDLAAATAALTRAFGDAGARAGVVRVGRRGGAPAVLVRPARPALGWAVAVWLVTHAPRYRIHTVRYRGFQWRAASGTAGWTRQNTSASASEVTAS